MCAHPTATHFLNSATYNLSFTCCLFQVSPTPSEVLIRLIGSREAVREAADSIVSMGKSHQSALASVKITTSTYDQ